MNLQFYLRFHTEFGETIWISGETPELGSGDPAKAVPLKYLNNEYWFLSIDVDTKAASGKGIAYKYIFRNRDGEQIAEPGRDRTAVAAGKQVSEIYLIDVWNHAGEYENALFTTAFSEVLLKDHKAGAKLKIPKAYTHIFRVKAPQLKKHEQVCLAGGDAALQSWSDTDPVLMMRDGDWWVAYLDLSAAGHAVAYKYGVWDTKEEALRQFEHGENRLFIAEAGQARTTILHDGFIHLPNTTWKGAGVSVPVFSLRSKNSFGIGEFSDLKLLVDWAKKLDMKLVQILPVNDTTATGTWNDSYPYAAISAFALHPIYINLSKVAGKKQAEKIKALRKKQKQLNELTDVDYEDTLRFKIAMLRELYSEAGREVLADDDYKKFFASNEHWLRPYAVFCYLRDKYKTAHFDSWKTHSVYREEEVKKLFSTAGTVQKEILFHCFIQYHLHLQLKDAADYANKKGIVLKGDIAIGIYRYGSDAWVEPALYNMHEQAGAPPDDFAVNGQNWGFPTYNWKKMQEDGFAWWKKRFEQMSEYFDAFRIDHILGFFRIWSIPLHAVQGIMGQFSPCIPVHYVEFGENGIWFDDHRFCKPFINDQVLWDTFGESMHKVKEQFLVPNEYNGYDLQPAFDTQRKVEEYFAKMELSEENARINIGLYDLISNVIMFKVPGSDGQEFHFRISMDRTSSFTNLIPHLQEKLKALYVNYFFRRQDQFWKKEAMKKLPQLKEATNMLICGEDLGMVPDTVPEVMKQLGILSLEIQRMPKDPSKQFFHPDDAPYLSVITPATHDMSTIRGWWEENREKTQQFYNHILGQWGDAPYFCEPWVCRAIVMQHLYSPAMWSIFQLQDLLGMSDSLRRQNPQEERINDPANPRHYWRYRMHLTLEELLQQDEFNDEVNGYVKNSGR
ncbi:MAG: 4-alpha-glucanotransferase [Chitinophagaceae bacterium]|nr:MAG: 4-alpha-glucanotransferase [Chitinophagaceae bacterium]